MEQFMAHDRGATEMHVLLPDYLALSGRWSGFPWPVALDMAILARRFLHARHWSLFLSALPTGLPQTGQRYGMNIKTNKSGTIPNPPTIPHARRLRFLRAARDPTIMKPRAYTRM